METDYSLELGPNAPALELPWLDPENRVRYVALRSEADAPEHVIETELEHKVDSIPEARKYPALRRLLIDVNSKPSAWQTAKSDVWPDETSPEDNLYDSGFTHSSYIDLVLASPFAALRDNREVHELAARKLAQMLEANETLEAYAEAVVRRCYFHRADNPTESDAGYCLTLFLVAYGANPEAAANCWSRTAEFASACLLTLCPQEPCPKDPELG